MLFFFINDKLENFKKLKKVALKYKEYVIIHIVDFSKKSKFKRIEKMKLYLKEFMDISEFPSIRILNI